MEITVGIFLLLLCFAFICEFIDSSLGMGYGTILTPLLILIGFEPTVAVPGVLLSQAFGGLAASIFHNQFENVSFKRDSKDLKIFFVISGFGILATIFAAVVSINIPKLVLTTYIGTLVFLMGFFVFWKHGFSFSWRKIIGIGLVSAFNKGLTGGGFGPVVTGGQILSGQDHKAAVGVTTFAQAPICICGFFTYLIGRTVNELPGKVLELPMAEFLKFMFSPRMFQWELILALLLGSLLVTPFGAFTTRSLNLEKVRNAVGGLMIILGGWILVRTWL